MRKLPILPIIFYILILFCFYRPSVLTEYSDLKIVKFIKVAWVFVFKVCKELEDNDDQVFPVSILENTSNVTTALEHTNLSNKSEPLEVNKVNCKRFWCPWSHNLKDCSWESSIRVLYNKERPVYLRDYKKIFSKIQENFKQMKASCWRRRVSVVFFQTKLTLPKDQKVNIRNNRWLCADPSKVLRVTHTKFPATAMVLGLLTMKDIWHLHISFYND